MRRRLGMPAVLACAVLAWPTAAVTKGPSSTHRYVQALFLLHHPAGLNRFVRAVSDPDSPVYRNYATVEQLVERFGASKAHRRATLSWLSARGLRGTVSPTGSYVTAWIPRPRAAAVLPLPARASQAAAASPRKNVPAGLRGHVTAIGFPATQAGAFVHSATVAPASLGAPQLSGQSSLLPHTGIAAGCPQGREAGSPAPLTAFTPNQYLTAYGHRALHRRGFRGDGTTAALVEIDGFRRSDIQAFGKCFGLKIPPIEVIPTGSSKPLPPGGETTLDLEILSAAAPDLDRIYVYEGGSSEAALMRTVAAALGTQHSRPDVISISLGGCEPRLNLDLAFRRALDNLFAVAAGAGISTLVAAGDQGSSACSVSTPAGETALPLLAVSDPASSPFVTAVGGTNLSLDAKNRIASQVAWNDAPEFFGGGGGGISLLSPRRPWWQQTPGLHEYGTGRLVPDLSALADVRPGYAIHCTAPICTQFPQTQPGWVAVGGTSAATPLIAGGILLANQYAARHRQPPLGFLNPLLYELGASEARLSAFYDVRQGSNDLGVLTPATVGGGHPLGCCPATRGYDAATGWGSPKLKALAQLAAGAAKSVP